MHCLLIVCDAHTATVDAARDLAMGTIAMAPEAIIRKAKALEASLAEAWEAYDRQANYVALWAAEFDLDGEAPAAIATLRKYQKEVRNGLAWVQLAQMEAEDDLREQAIWERLGW